VATSNT